MEDKLIKSDWKGYPFPVICPECKKEISKVIVVASSSLEAVTQIMNDQYTEKLFKLLREHFEKNHNE